MFLILEPAVVTSPCPLLPAEVASDFLPPVCMKVPRQSAWVPLQINVAEYLDDDGSILTQELEAALVESVDAGDQLHDQMEWDEPMIEYDSWMNRRLAIALRGWGDIVARRGDDPTQLQTLRDLEELADWACQGLHQRSKSLAASNSWCPALDEAGANLLNKRRSRAWGERWRQAIRDVAVRHRNLTTMSPWDVFPTGKTADLRFADLLPLTRYADSLSFQRNVSIDHWNVNDFNSFHERVAAIVRCNAGADLVAKKV